MNILNEKTVIITGAGASKEYGYPLGSELREMIRNALNDKHLIAILDNQGISSELIKEFKALLLYSTRYETIDSLLEHHPRFQKMGRLGIAFTLLPMGQFGTIFPAKQWYKSLFDSVEFDGKSSKADNLSIVTLNYEQSLQCFLENAYRFECHEKQYEIAQNNIAKVGFTYAHGTLGPFSHEKLKIAPDNYSLVVDVANNMKLICDNVEDSDNFRQAVEIIKEAKNVVFLGFGYEKRTVQRLLGLTNGKKAGTEKNYYGTAYKLPPEIRKQVLNMFNHRIALFDCIVSEWFKRIKVIDKHFSPYTSKGFDTSRQKDGVLITEKEEKNQYLLPRRLLQHLIHGDVNNFLKEVQGSADAEDIRMLKSMSWLQLAHLAQYFEYT